MDPKKRAHFRHAMALVAALSAASAADADEAGLPALQSYGGQFTRLVPIEQVPSNKVLTLDGRIASVSEFRGRAVLLNFWATWCAACIYELPALERLTARYQTDDVAVMAVSIDRDGLLDVLPFLRKYNLTGLAVYLDPEQILGSRFIQSETAGALPLFGLPVTYVIDSKGYVLGYISGAVEWDSSEARNFVDHLRQSSSK